MKEIKRMDSGNQDFLSLVRLLDAELSQRDGSEHSFYATFNKVDKIKYAVVAYKDRSPVGCGAIKEYNEHTMEVKRMFTLPYCRGKGIGTLVLLELEKWANELSFGKCILETGKKQPEAIALYKKNGYRIIPNYGQYVNVTNSICFEKVMRTA